VTSERPDALERARRRGRRVGLVVFGACVGGLTTLLSVQILQQVWWPPIPETDLGCRQGIQTLFAAVHRARRAASGATGGELEALHRFRTALQPEWSYRPAFDERCAGEAEALRSLAVLDKLRYAEEHAVRYEATSLAALRRRAAELGFPPQPR
jgi:hypothetical protein